MRRSPAGTATHAGPSPPIQSLDQYKEQMNGLTQALNDGGLPSLLPVEMDRKAARGTTDTDRTSRGRTTGAPTRTPTPPVPAASSPVVPTAALSSPIFPPNSQLLPVEMEQPTSAPPELRKEEIEDIEAQTSLAKLKHLLFDARQQQRHDKATIDRQQNTIRELAQKLNSVSQFIDMQEDLEDRLRGIEQQHQVQLDEQKEVARVARLEMLESRVKLRSLEEQLKREHEADVTARANQLLDARTASVNEENFELLADRVMLSRDATDSKARGAALAEQNAKLRREAELRHSTEEELLRRSARQKKEILDLKRQVKTMDDNLDRVAADYEAQLEAQKKRYEAELSAVTVARDAAQRDALRLHSELSKLRQLSAQMVSQRSELEAFFHAALADVKREIIAERRQLVCGASPGVTGPQTNSSALRIETQPRLALTAEARERGKRQWTVDKRGLPVLLDPAKVSAKALPPIPVNASATPSTNTLHQSSAPSPDGVPWEWEGAVAVYEDDTAVLHEDTTMRAAGLSAVPDAPTLRDLKSVKIEQLNWREKERVLQSLFRRLQRSRPAPTHHVATAADTSEVETAVAPVSAEDEVPDDSNTFLTQQ